MLKTDIPVRGNFLPALGPFLSPFQGVWRSVVPETASYDFSGKVSAPVRILFDDRDVPHIYAETLEDALFAQGYLHAANRLFSMDVSSRAAAGRLSEIIGPKTLEIDRRQRERGFEWSAGQKAGSWEADPKNKPLIEAYVQGVNTYISSLDYASLPLEYKILSCQPIEWTTMHSALMLTNMAISLCLGEDDLEYTTAQQKLSAADYSFLFPDHNAKESPIIPLEKTWDFQPVSIPGDTSSMRSGIESNKDRRQDDLNGSNNWAVSGQKTKNGFPILANDPHLSLTLPNIWYEMEIHTPDMHVHGVSLPGLPFIIIGFNEHIAWGSTNSGQDVLDWFPITWKDSTRHEYLLDGKYIKPALRPEEILIRGHHPLTDTIRYTHWGPVTHTDEHKDMAMKWIGHQKTKISDFDYLLNINKAKNIEDYRKAVSYFQYPAQNKIFASGEGDIAISVAGIMPLRPQGLGENLTDGTKTSNDWQGFIPFEHAPYIINPKRGFVSSANQSPAGTDYPYPLIGKRIFEDYRGRMVNMLLDSMQGITVEDMMMLQQNNYNLLAAELLPSLLSAVNENGCLTAEEKKLADRIGKWNFEYHRDSIGPVLFELWYQAFEKNTWEELDTLHVFRPEEWRLVELCQQDATNKYFDHASTGDKKETMQDIACLSFKEMATEFLKIPDAADIDWGSYKASVIPHLARFPHFGVDSLHASGGKHIINAMSKTHGPSWRMIVELSNPPKAWVNYPGGQSGDPANPHYMDMVREFFEGKYHEVSIMPNPNAWNPVREIKIQPL